MIVLALLFSILGCDSPGKHLEQGNTLAASGDPTGALTKYAEVIDGWPESEEAVMATAAAADVQLSVLDSHLESGDNLAAARFVQAILGGPYSSDVTEGVEERRSSKKELAEALTWLESTSDELEERATLAMRLVDEAPYLDAETRPWLMEHLPAAYKDRCTDPLNDLAAVSDLGRLDEIETDCLTLATFSAESEEGKAARAAIDEFIPARRDAIKRSPAYRTEEAFRKCREFSSYARSAKSRAQTYAIQGRQDDVYREQEKLERKANEFRPTIEYLRERFQAMEDGQARYNLAKRIERECQL